MLSKDMAVVAYNHSGLWYHPTRQAYRSHKFAFLSPTTLLQTVTTLHNTFLFLTLGLPNQHMKENVITLDEAAVKMLWRNKFMVKCKYVENYLTVYRNTNSVNFMKFYYWLFYTESCKRSVGQTKLIECICFVKLTIT